MRTAPQRPPSDLVWSLQGQTMGTTWSARVVPAPGSDQAALQAAIEAELTTVVNLFSHWEPRSELSRFNNAPAGVWAVSQGFWDLLTASLDIADDTDGAVDPTLGAVVDLWGFGPPGPRPANDPVPSDEAIAAALSVSGFQALRLNRDARGVMQPGGMRLDLSAIAKGHAVDRVSARLEQEGATSHLIEIGGELKGRGVKPDGQPWWVEIEAPPGSTAQRTVVALFDLAVATSGDYRRAFQHQGRTYPHTISGRTGRPVDHGLVSVTVFHEKAMMADAWSTALTVMGPVEGPPFADAMGLAACFTSRDDQGLIEIVTPAWHAMMEEDETAA